MEVSDADIARVPAGNVRVPREDFAAVWRAAEQRQDGPESDWHSAGIVVTCRWLAQAVVRPRTGPPRVARSPVLGRTAIAHPESIAQELLAAEKLIGHPPGWLDDQPGWLDAVVATLNWAWRGAEPPLDD